MLKNYIIDIIKIDFNFKYIINEEILNNQIEEKLV